MIQKIKNIFGWSSPKKIIVFESDDWGSERFPSRAVRNQYINKGYPVRNCWMSFLDTFESNRDVSGLLGLFDEMDGVGASKPKFTFLFNPANPDFEKIEENNFRTYFYESFIDRIDRTPASNKLIQYYQSAIQSSHVEMAFHGREHLYVNRWLRDLQSGESELLNGFGRKFWGYSKSYYPSLKHSYRSSFALDLKEDLSLQYYSITEGVALMEEMFGKPIQYFLAPDGPFSLSLLPSLKQSGIRYIGLPKLFRDAETNKYRLFWLGRKLRNGMRVITRNASFEPASPRQTDWVDTCMTDINNAFKWRKPAVISTHRANYVGGLEPSNRANGLGQLKLLLQRINNYWPEALFLKSSQLGDLMSRRKTIDELA